MMHHTDLQRVPDLPEEAVEKVARALFAAGKAHPANEIYEEQLSDFPTEEQEAVRKMARAAIAAIPAQDALVGWRCFHCDEVFTDRKLAEDHFGLATLFPAACIDPLRSDERAMRERAVFYERSWREALSQRDAAWAERDALLAKLPASPAVEDTAK